MPPLKKTSQSDWEASFALIGVSTDYNFRLSVAFATGISIASCQAKTSITASRRPSFMIFADPNNGSNFAERRKSTLVLISLVSFDVLL